jgi:hypothetical protein
MISLGFECRSSTWPASASTIGPRERHQRQLAHSFDRARFLSLDSRAFLDFRVQESYGD